MYHKILVLKPSLRSILHNKIKAGDRIHLMGKISYQPVVVQGGKQRQKAAIIVDEIYLCNDGTITTTDYLPNDDFTETSSGSSSSDSSNDDDDDEKPQNKQIVK